MRFSPGCNCCGGAGNCTNCSGDAPTSLSAVVSGIANAAGPLCLGDDCPNLNTTYVLDADTPPCTWIYNGVSVCGAGGGIMDAILSDIGGGQYEMVVGMLINTRLQIAWKKTYTGKPDCAAWSSESIPLFSYIDFGFGGFQYCDGSAIGACLLTAL